jgi:hypothetical protein
VEAGANYNRYTGQDGVLRSWELDAEVEVVFRSGWQLEVERFDEYKLFVQSNSAIDKDNVQALFVWRFKPPFGSLQVAYQRGTSALGDQLTGARLANEAPLRKLAWITVGGAGPRARLRGYPWNLICVMAAKENSHVHQLRRIRRRV